MKLIGTLVLSALCLNGLYSFGKDTPTAKPYSETLGAAPAAELPAAAASLVKAAKVRDRETITPEVVKAGVKLNPAAAAPIVGAIAKAVPDMAGLAAATAAAEQPKQASAIARAAAAAAPAKAGKIVAAVCQAVPNQYRAVAVAVAEVVPTSGKEIVKSVGTAVPELKPYIDAQMTGSGLGVFPVGVTLDQAGHALSQVPVTAPTTPVAGSPATAANSSSDTTANSGTGNSGPPALSRPGSSGSTTPNTIGNQVSPSRNYARP
jgi:hypothetical protein